MSSSELPNDNRPLVCIVDDDLSIRESLSSLFRSAGLKVETFPSAEEFLSNAHFEALKCLILDCPDRSRSLHGQPKESGRLLWFRGSKSWV